MSDAPTDETPTTSEPSAPAPEQPAAAEQPPQDSFDAEYVKKLRRENAEWRTKARHNEEAAKKLAEIEEANKTEAQKQAEQLQALQQENEQLRIQALTAQVAQAKGVPANLLRGSSQEELEAAADELLAFRGNTPTPDFGAGNRGDSLNPAEALDQQIADAEKSGDVRTAITLKRQRYALQNQ